MRYQRYEKQDEEDEEQDLSETSECDSNSTEADGASYESNNKKHQCPIKHLQFSFHAPLKLNWQSSAWFRAMPYCSGTDLAAMICGRPPRIPGVEKMAADSNADPSKMAPFDADDENIVHVIIETPKGSRNKHVFDPVLKIFQLKKVLPEGMAFPYDFGFIPSTKAEDGDPVDVLVLMDEPAFAGCLLKCRVIGVIEGEQGKKKQKARNDRIVAIEQANHSFADVKHIKELGGKFVQSWRNFSSTITSTWAKGIEFSV